MVRPPWSPKRRDFGGRGQPSASWRENLAVPLLECSARVMWLQLRDGRNAAVDDGFSYVMQRIFFL